MPNLLSFNFYDKGRQIRKGTKEKVSQKIEREKFRKEEIPRGGKEIMKNGTEAMRESQEIKKKKEKKRVKDMGNQGRRNEKHDK